MPVNNHAPNTEQLLIDLEKRVKALETQPALNAGGITSGGIKVTGGTVTVYTDTGLLVGEYGKLTDALGGWGLRLVRTNAPSIGANAFRFRGGFIGFQDAAQNVITSDDVTSGVGIARPHLDHGYLADTNVTKWPSTTNGTWTTIANCMLEIQNPRIHWTMQIFANNNTTGQFRMLFGGAQLGSVVTLVGGPSGAFATWDDTQQAYVGGVGWGNYVLMECQAQVTAGTGNVSAQQLMLQGTQS